MQRTVSSDSSPAESREASEEGHRILGRVQKCFFGELYLIEELKTKTRFYKQVVTAEEIMAFDENLLKQFKHFLQILKLSSDWSLKMIDINEDLHDFYIIFFYCNEGSLYDKLKYSNKIFSEEDVFKMIKDILCFFFLMETRRGIFHRDLKLENIFAHNGHYIVGGLDLSEYGASSPSCLCGSTAYLAPEVFKQLLLLQSSGSVSSLKFSRKADIYSLGIICLEMLTGRPINSWLPAKKWEDLAGDLGTLTNVETYFAFQDSIKEALRTLKDTPFSRVLGYMLEPDPDRRCTFEYLYQWFGFNWWVYFSKKNLSLQARGFQSGQTEFKNTNLVQGETNFIPLEPESLVILSEENDQKIMEIRQEYYRRINHEYFLIQFLCQVTQDILSLSLSLSGPFSKTLSLLAVSLGVKAKVCKDLLMGALLKGGEAFSLKDWDKYKNSRLYQIDTHHLSSSLKADPPCLGISTDMLIAFIESQIQGLGPDLSLFFSSFDKEDMEANRHMVDHILTRVLSDLNNPSNSLANHLSNLSSQSQSSQEKSQKGELQTSSQMETKEYLRMAADCLYDRDVFRYFRPGWGLFDWQTFLTTKYQGLARKYAFQKIYYPQKE